MNIPTSTTTSRTAPEPQHHRERRRTNWTRRLAVGLPFLLAVPLAVYAADPPAFAFVTGLCRVLSFVTDTVAAVMLALAIAGYSLLHAFGEARDGVMGTVLRIGFGGSIAVGAVSAVSWLFSKTACPSSGTTKMVLDLVSVWIA